MTDELTEQEADALRFWCKQSHGMTAYGTGRNSDLLCEQLVAKGYLTFSHSERGASWQRSVHIYRLTDKGRGACA